MRFVAGRLRNDCTHEKGSLWSGRFGNSKPETMMRLTMLATILVTLSMAMPLASAQEEASYQELARDAYQDAMEDFEDGDFIDAARKFNIVRTRYTYSQFAALAELRLADVYYEQDKFSSAIEQYRGFVKLHPNHEKVVYAAFRTAMAFYGQMPDDWFFMPPSYEKDLSKVRDAEREFRFFLARYPKSDYASEANKRLAEVRRRLADHEFYVAEFYLKRDNPRAAAMRLTYLLEKYSGLGLDARALYLLGRSYVLLGDTKKAKAALEDLVEFHSQTSWADDARDYLAENNL